VVEVEWGLEIVVSSAVEDESGLYSLVFWVNDVECVHLSLVS
jgi:hypothetical protein